MAVKLLQRDAPVHEADGIDANALQRGAHQVERRLVIVDHHDVCPVCTRQAKAAHCRENFVTAYGFAQNVGNGERRGQFQVTRHCNPDQGRVMARALAADVFKQLKAALVMQPQARVSAA